MGKEDSNGLKPMSRRRYVSAMAGFMGTGIGSTEDGTIGSIAGGNDAGDHDDTVAAVDETWTDNYEDTVTATDETDTVTVNLYQTQSQTAEAEEADVEPLRALNVIKSYAEYAFNDLYDRAEKSAQFEANVVGEPERPMNDANLATLRGDFAQYVADNSETASKYGNLIVDANPEQDSLMFIGASDIPGGDFPYETCHGTRSDAGALVHGEKLLKLDPEEVVEEFKIKEYDAEEDEYRKVRSNIPFLIGIGGVHEFGHMECMGHRHGSNVYEPDDDEPERAIQTMMQPRGTPLKDADVYRTFTFSEDAVDYVRGE